VLIYLSSLSDSARLERLLQELKQLQQTLSANLTLTVTIINGDNNAWGDMFKSWIFTLVSRIILPVFALCCFYVATIRFIGYWKFEPSKLALFCLFVEAITNLVRAVYTIIDPFTSQNIFPFQVHRILLMITTPWSLGTSMLIALYWAERYGCVCVYICIYMYVIFSHASNTHIVNTHTCYTQPRTSHSRQNQILISL